MEFLLDSGIYTYASIGGTLLSLMLGGILLYRTKSRKKKEKELADEKQRLKEKEDLINQIKEEVQVGSEIEDIEEVKAQLLKQIADLRKKVEEKQTSSSTYEPPSYKKITGKPIGWAGPAGIHALSRLPSRDIGLRRKYYRQFWHEKTVPADAYGDIVFFRETSHSNRISNMEQCGQIPIYQSAMIKKFVIKFPSTSSKEDINKLLDELVFTVRVEGDLAQRFVRPTQIKDFEAVYDVGEIYLGAGQSFNVVMHFARQLELSADVIPTVVLETMIEEPIS